jgi:uncharacterized membrane protein
MNLGQWIHFAHIAGAMVWVGGGLTLSVIGYRARRNVSVEGLAQFAKNLSFLGLALFTPAVIVVLLSGIWLVFDFGGDFTRPWVLLALAAFVIAFLIGAIF